METALQISFYVVGAVFALGVLMVALLVRDVFFSGQFRIALPPIKRVPSTALDAARGAQDELQKALQAATGELRDTLAYELRHLEMRIEALEDKSYTDQSDYYGAIKARERVWREWRALHQESRRSSFRERRKLRVREQAFGLKFRRLSRDVDEEYARAVARDTLTLEELHATGVLDPEVLRPRQGPPPTHAAEPPVQPPAPEPKAEAKPEAQPDGKPKPAANSAGQRPHTGRPTGQPGKWITRLPPYPPAEGGLLGQEDLARPNAHMSQRTYVDPTFSMAGLPNGLLANADFGRSSLAEVEFVGPQRFLGCSFVATDLRRIEMRLADGPHVFQDCDLRGASLAQAQLSGVVFRRCNLASTHWRSARLDRVKFESCRLDNVRWEGVDLSRTVMSGDMLERADFAFASKPPLNLRPALESPPELPGQAPAPAAAGQEANGTKPAEAPVQGQSDAPAHDEAGADTGPPSARDGAAVHREE